MTRSAILLEPDREGAVPSPKTIDPWLQESLEHSTVAVRTHRYSLTLLFEKKYGPHTPAVDIAQNGAAPPSVGGEVHAQFGDLTPSIDDRIGRWGRREDENEPRRSKSTPRFAQRAYDDRKRPTDAPSSTDRGASSSLRAGRRMHLTVLRDTACAIFRDERSGDLSTASLTSVTFCVHLTRFWRVRRVDNKELT